MAIGPTPRAGDRHAARSLNLALKELRKKIETL
jgi:hypothetical protein